MDADGRLSALFYAILYKALGPPWTMVSIGDPGTNPPWMPRDDCTSRHDSNQGSPPLTQSSKETKGFLHVKYKTCATPAFFVTCAILS